jgi:transposase
MSRKGLSMRKAREILRLRLGVGLSSRQVAASCRVAPSTVLEYDSRAKEAGLSWPLPEDMDDEALERIIRSKLPLEPNRPMPDTDYLIREMRRAHVTLYLLWLEYRDQHPDGYGYTQFCLFYNQAKHKLSLTMRQEHKAGEKLFTDYAGDTLSVINPNTGESSPVYIFVAVLGASNHTYAQGTLDMALPSWIDSHIRAFEYMGGVPQIIVPDNTKCAVIKPDRYEPDLNREFADMAAHYGCAVIPTRVRKPRDKAKVENGVLVVERWILASLRNRVFFSLDEVNDAIAELLERLNTRKFKNLDASRRELFESLDKPALSPLPPTRYHFAEWKSAKVNIDYHIAVDKHFYSVPYPLAREQVDVRLTATTVEVFYKNRRVASHIRSYVVNRHTTNPEHMPKSHREYLEWSPSRIISWAGATGPNTAALVESILERKQHPELGYRSCLGIVRLATKFPPERVEAASARALRANAISYKSLKSILDNGLDRLPVRETPTYTPQSHQNIRGSQYYSRPTTTDIEDPSNRHVTLQPSFIHMNGDDPKGGGN